MGRRALPIFCSLLVIAVVVVSDGLGQHEREVPSSKRSNFGPEFLSQLDRLFERLSNADLHRVFEAASPLRCSELVQDTGEWQDVAFFNGRRTWYRSSVAELQNNPDLYVFKGVCSDQLATLKVATRVRVDESRTGGNERSDSTKTNVRVNAPVTASFTRDIKGYTFDLPYLFRAKDQDGRTVFGFEPRRQSDKYLTHITSHWECKAVAEEFLTYNFLICRVTLFGHDPMDIKPDMRDKSSTSYGAVAYFLLSNGKEASFSVK
jgi:hypothetical protein